ncbi:hypothetical protein [Treponema zioleckii]|uniref:hypothetical protein n=1 Tax=Treponema zioleckii TaxID=331680 RepID=UPI00168B6A0F|nr:hypothetical protein [Treponema zioleckii]
MKRKSVMVERSRNHKQLNHNERWLETTSNKSASFSPEKLAGNAQEALFIK